MISVQPEGRLANNLFQYVFARLLHEATGLALSYTVGTQILKTPPIDGIKGSGEKILVSDFFDTGEDHLLEMDEIIKSCLGKNVLVRGFFQHKSYFNHRRDEVKKWLGEIPLLNPEFTGIHIRKTDYVTLGWDLKDEYYDKCIKLANPKKLIIFTDEPRNNYVKKLISEGGTLCLESPEKSMYLLGTCGKQIMSRSSFSWWSAFLSSAKTVYYPRPSSGFWSKKDTPEKDIEVDSNEYSYVELP